MTLDNLTMANLRVLEIEEIKSLPHLPMSHPFVERLSCPTRGKFSAVIDQFGPDEAGWP